jgi:hypothetical protein
MTREWCGLHEKDLIYTDKTPCELYELGDSWLRENTFQTQLNNDYWDLGFHFYKGRWDEY